MFFDRDESYAEALAELSGIGGPSRSAMSS